MRLDIPRAVLIGQRWSGARLGDAPYGERTMRARIIRKK